MESAPLAHALQIKYTLVLMSYRARRTTAVIVLALFAVLVAYFQPTPPPVRQVLSDQAKISESPLASEQLAKLEIKGRSPKTGYSRSQFGEGWGMIGQCDVRNIILQRDMTDKRLDPTGCKVLEGNLNDPYTGQLIDFVRGEQSSQEVQIDHVVALSDSWQKGAQQLSGLRRKDFANDPLNLLAVDGSTNMEKGDADAASWLPPNKSYRCQYVARQIAVKRKFNIWITEAEYDAMKRVLGVCPDQRLPLEFAA